MSSVAAYPHIVKEPNAPAALESHPLTRVAMIVMDYLARGLSSEEIVAHYPYLTLSEVHAAMAYYHDHRDEIDREIASELAVLEQDSVANERSSIWHKLKSKGLV